MNRIRLRPGIHYAPIQDGVYFSSARATFVMSGPPILFRVVDTCLPLLEDGTDIDELVAAMGTPAARPLVSHLVATLDSRGLVLHLDHFAAPEPSAAEQQRYPETLAYLETHRNDPYADFRLIRAARVVVAGPAEALGPAVRGLLRAGIGRLLVATPEPQRLASLAARHPEVHVQRWSEGAPFPILIADQSPDAVLLVVTDAVPFEAKENLPSGCVLVAVRLGKELAVVGPAVRDEAVVSLEVRWSRAVSWCGGDLLVRPSGDLLAGALAGQVVFDALVGLNVGQVHLVYGGDLSADAITAVVGSSGPELHDATEWPAPLEAPSPPDAEWWRALAAPWSGLFQLSVPGDLPQMPRALTLATGRSHCFDGRTVGVGPDQETSTTEAALEALRRHCEGIERSMLSLPLEAREAQAFAAGVDEREWLLDGALRLLSSGAGPGELTDARPVAWLGIDDVEARRLWRALEEYELLPVRLSYCNHPDLDWVLVTVWDRQSDTVVARGWGPTLAVGAIAALSNSIATQQVRRVVDAGFAGSGGEAGLISHLHRPRLDDLAAALGSWLDATGRRLLGHRLAADPVAGTIGACCGPVWFHD